MLYLLSAIGANAISLLWNIHTGDVMVVSAGASGAIFGVLGALLAILLRRRGHVDGISRNQLFLVIGFTPVSYTHLFGNRVRKMGKWKENWKGRSADWKIRPSSRRPGCRNSCGAVSYTHLDVYKRQEF